MDRRIATLLVLIALLTDACSRHDSQQTALYEAELMMDSNPAGALTLLDSIDSDKLTSAGDKALYALMYSRARDKNYIDVTDDSLINEAITYYADRDDDIYKEMAYYYLACVKCNARDYAGSMIAASEALRIARVLDNDRETARAYELMADLHNATYNSRRALEYRHLARRHYSVARLPRETAGAELDLAIAYYNDRQYKRSIALLDSLSAANPDDPLLQAHCLSAVIRPLLYTGNYARAEKVAERLNGYNGVYPLTGQDYANLAEIALHAGDLDKARSYIEQGAVLTPEALQLEMARYRLHLQNGNSDSLINDYRRIAYRQNSILAEVLQHPVTSAELEYAGSMTDEATDSTARAKRTGTIIAIALLAIIIGVVIVMNLQLAMKNAEIKRHVADIKSMTRQLSETRDETSRLNRRTEALFHERFKTLDKLCSEYYEAIASPSPQLKKAVYNNITKMLTDMRRPAELAKLKAIVNEHLHGIITKAETQLPDLDDSDIAFLTYIYAGFSAKAVCLFTDISKGNFYVRKRRLRSLILNSGAIDRDLLLTGL